MRLLIFFFLFLSACGQQSNKAPAETSAEISTMFSEESSENDWPITFTKKSIYLVKEIGWSFQMPAGWEIISKQELEVLKKSRNELYKNTPGQNMNSKQADLVCIRKHKKMNLYSCLAPYNETVIGSYDDNIIQFHETIKTIYKENNFNTTYEIGAVRIGGIMFDRFKVIQTDFGKKGNTFHQAYLKALINGFDFTISISYTDEVEEETLINIVGSSKFSIK